MDYFRYNGEAIDYLKARDSELGRAIDRIGRIERGVIPDLFEALVSAIVAQQISAKAAATVWGRVAERCAPITPGHLATLPVEEIQGCGMSMRKAGYIRESARTIEQGEVDLSALPALEDGQVIQRLSSLPGIGVWTAEMLMIFSMQRPDVVSWGDLGIRRGMRILYGQDSLDRAQFDGYRRRYSPYGSVASLYLWRIAVE
ncbi:HhH-GPD superfamily base excision DNA repair protein [Longilinea arvoryzae]|uniref:DNA-3-methyladenine glycosylase II n=1 Tax=Longilinea arvoryzae TaxID=360412 RepID=A0A0S7BNN9_9CHLR|nr:DNA-3-methyladenine glycosylase [Longilinea arvoryzae]GAP15675.1 HhH-GPD superfamily base excision DNA repair protein [Longilinea arvoryzae]